MSAVKLRIVKDEGGPIGVADTSLRPISFDTYVGQTEVVDQVRDAVSAAKRGGWQLDHILLGGPAGLGKTSLAAVIAAELGAKCHVTSAPAIEHRGQIASLLTSLEEGDVLFIDEIHALDRVLAETLYQAMEDRVLDMPAGKRVIRVPLPRFTLVAATTHAGKLPKPLLDRFGLTCQLRPYTEDELGVIVSQNAQAIGVTIDVEGAQTIARASRGTPRLANRALRRVRDMVTNIGAAGAIVPHGSRASITGPIAAAALRRLQIDPIGLGLLDRRYLAIVADRPVGIEALCAALGEDRSTIEESVEPHLIQAGLIMRTGKGRVATDAGRAHLASEAE